MNRRALLTSGGVYGLCAVAGGSAIAAAPVAAQAAVAVPAQGELTLSEFVDLWGRLTPEKKLSVLRQARALIPARAGQVQP